MDEENKIDVEEVEAHVDNGPEDTETYPDSRIVDDFADQESTVSVGRTDYDSGGNSSLDGTEPTVIRLDGVFHEGTYPEMRSSAYLTDEQAVRIAKDLLHEVGRYDMCSQLDRSLERGRYD